MPYIGAPAPLESSPAAGGVLSGTYPNPGFASSPATATQAASKSAYLHTHSASAINTGKVAMARIPTSTSTTLSAVPRADDPRLNSTTSRDWDQYGVTSSIDKNDVPTWNGSVYIPRPPPPPGSVVDATASRKGGIVLKGELGGTASAPRVARRAPLGPAFEYVIASGGQNNGQLRVDLNLAVNYTADVASNAYESPIQGEQTISATVILPSTASGGQMVTVRLYALLATRYINTVVLNNAAFNSPGVLTIPTGKIGVLQYFFSLPASRWVVLQQYAEA